MSKIPFPVLLSCLFALSPLRAETMRVELKYVAVADVLEMWVRASDGAAKDEVIEAVVKKGEAAINGTTVKIDERLNSLEIDGKAGALEGMRALLKEIDVRPDQVLLKCVLMEVKLDDALKSGPSLFRADFGNGTPIIKGEEADLDALVKKAEDSKRATVRSRPCVYTANNQEARIATDALDADLFTLNVTPLVHSADEVTVTMEATTTKEGSTSQLNTTVRLGNGNVVIVGGSIGTDKEGNRTETLLLLQPEIIKGEVEVENAGDLGK